MNLSLSSPAAPAPPSFELEPATTPSIFPNGLGPAPAVSVGVQGRDGIAPDPDACLGSPGRVGSPERGGMNLPSPSELFGFSPRGPSSTLILSSELAGLPLFGDGGSSMTLLYPPSPGVGVRPLDVGEIELSRGFGRW